MTCLTEPQLAAVAAGEGADALFDHVAACDACRSAAETQQAIRTQLEALARPKPIARGRREELAASILASAEYEPPVALPWWRMLGTVGLGLAAAAATIALLARDTVATTSPSITASITESIDVPDLHVVATANDVAPPSPRLPRLISVDADGATTVDASDAPIRIVADADTTLTSSDARLRVTSHRGAIVEVAVFAGSVELTGRGQRLVIHAGDMWRAPAAATEPAALDRGMGAFRTGWTALREARYADAIAAFDRATDPVIAEDASYWAAIATLRSGDKAGAKARLSKFVDTFRDSPRLTDAIVALDRL